MILTGDCLDILPTLPAESVDSIVTDPPYGLKFMGKSWDHGIPGVPFWVEALRVAKPGAFLLAFGGTRTHHRLMVAIEDAGWEIRDVIMWVYGSGFPKSHNVANAIDKHEGMGNRGHAISSGSQIHPTTGLKRANGELLPPYEARTEKGKPWEGWGTALKPAWEPIIVARKPIAGTVAANVLKYGTGAMNINGCRVECDKGEVAVDDGIRVDMERDACHEGYDRPNATKFRTGKHNNRSGPFSEAGRWPANLIHDGSDEVVALFPHSKSGAMLKPYTYTNTGFSLGAPAGETRQIHESNEGSAARFFYCAKASRQDRNEGCGELPEKLSSSMSGRRDASDMEGFKTDNDVTERFTTLRKNNHPTVKPTALMVYLVRLVTPPGGTCLDMFCGSGSTGKACAIEGFKFIGIDEDANSTEISEKRVEAARLPLFGGQP